MAQERKYPIELLEQPTDLRKKYFEEKLISHPKLEAAYQETKMKVLENSTPLVFLYGPSGVGKSTLLTKLWNEIITSMKIEMEIDKGFIPVIYFESKSPESIKFNWGDYFRSGLMAIKEPCIDNKIIPSNQIRHEIAKSSSKESFSTLRWAFESALIHRRTLACIVDEAQHIAKIPRGSKLVDQMDVLKSLSNLTKVPHLLAGTYEILKFRNQSAQLSNRSNDVHLSRYKVEYPEDRKGFKTAVLSFQDHLPVHEVDLISHWQLLYKGSIGCIGILKKWLERALDDCLNDMNNQGVSLTLSHLEKTAPSTKQNLKMIEEARAGELELTESEEEKDHLLALLGLTMYQNEVGNKNVANKAKPKKSKRPGERNPHRDQVGITIP